jgi:23S rRNA pseudouridine2605 synthase
MRIAKFIASSGLCSRREAERLIERGEVCVNGEVLTTPAFKVSDQDDVLVSGKALPAPQKAKIWLFHKPRSVLTTRSDPEGRKTIYDFLPDDMQQLHHIGRLDYNSEGLLLLTNNGELKRHYEMPKTALERHYRVRMRGVPKERDLRQLRQGITVEGVNYRPILAEIEQEGSNSWLKVILTEGKNREIRKVFEHLGHPVSRLIRLGYGEHALGKLPAGKWKKAG